MRPDEGTFGAGHWYQGPINSHWYDFHLPYISRSRRIRGRNYAHAGIQRGAVNHSVKCRSGGMYVHSRSRDFHGSDWPGSQSALQH